MNISKLPNSIGFDKDCAFIQQILWKQLLPSFSDYRCWNHAGSESQHRQTQIICSSSHLHWFMDFRFLLFLKLTQIFGRNFFRQPHIIRRQIVQQCSLEVWLFCDYYTISVTIFFTNPLYNYTSTICLHTSTHSVYPEYASNWSIVTSTALFSLPAAG